ncbi:hypothetical protein COCSUDRAFT_62775 [Coccomyxa subellipsoidea C-169]|uniref:Uncharacterized protein n=1 Tax=Coccomyxa subellipsoidea (strain C-169) TaxID=574566 RepID=I0Z0V2_COCSC|nr:hypothetical protein COCSUDRAFT_62775 [Coccomyxa subellipsoidea C-169]EIE24271.1 hypothetical protein COCSUDRAFT_62775 [Coccomyxa subellipsoidea C-169]|eukprot:XP_005648815.1 hypothetical protein COCSUDRAFT_62775 [Coccomyxa subellipsoidea C-169]
MSAGVLSDWLRGRDPTLSREEFTARWCHRGVLCTVDALPDAQPVIRWSAQHPEGYKLDHAKLDQAGQPGQRTLGYETGLEADHQLHYV